MQGDVQEALHLVGELLQPEFKGRERLYQKVKTIEEETDIVQKEITTFTVSLMQAGQAGLDQSDRAYAYVRAADELESIADYAVSIITYMKRLEKNELDFSEDAWKDLKSFHAKIFAFFTLVEKTLQSEASDRTSAVREEAGRLNELADDIRDSHLDRMKAGSCGALSALIFSDMAIALRRIKNHTVNLHEALSVEVQ
jgi:phosphate:Na+ symporter